MNTRAEATGYTETTRYEQVLDILGHLQRQSRLVRLESFGRSEEGRSLPLVVLSSPLVYTPEDALRTGKPRVFVMANIHAGEVEGKEAMLAMCHRLVDGDLRPLLDRLVILIAPIYNADGNERISTDNRPEQNGPIGGVGTRENARGLDLNRDYMKLESSEAQALITLFNRWDPHVIVDLHTTNGSFHGYHLTYSPSLTPNADASIIEYSRRALPEIGARVLERWNFRTHFYGNFSTLEDLNAEVNDPRQATGTPVWRTFDHRPRFGNNYTGLRNRIAILSEAYSYCDFKTRIEVTSAFVETILNHVADDASGIVELIAEADRRQAGSRRAQGMRFALDRMPEDVSIQIGDVEEVLNTTSGRKMLAVTGGLAAMQMPDFARFAAVSALAMPLAYTFADDDTGRLIRNKLEQHGIRVTTVERSVHAIVEAFQIEQVSHSDTVFQGHRETTVKGRWDRVEKEIPSGWILAGTDQPLSSLLFYMVEAQSDDGLVTWNFLDTALDAGHPYPVYRIVEFRPAATAPERTPA